MIAGTIAQLDHAADDPLETAFQGGDLPALDVEQTQTTFEDTPVQSGVAATRIEVEREQASVTVDPDGDATGIHTTREPVLTDVTTNWVADVTESGLLAAASVGGDGPFDFPFDLIAAQTDRTPQRLTVDIEAMHEDWVEAEADGLADAWMTGEDDGESTAMQYHDAADVETRPTIGLGFVRPWNGTVEKGVVYASGYVAVYTSDSATSFVQFVRDEVLPYASAGDDGGVQATLDTDPECEGCGRPSENLTDYDGERLCPVCINQREEGL